MKTKNLLGILMLFLFTFIFISCDKDDLADKVETIRMHVSAETDTYTPWGSDTPVECMLVKEEGSVNFSKLSFNSIDGFVYKKVMPNLSPRIAVQSIKLELTSVMRFGTFRK